MLRADMHAYEKNKRTTAAGKRLEPLAQTISHQASHKDESRQHMNNFSQSAKPRKRADVMAKQKGDGHAGVRALASSSASAGTSNIGSTDNGTATISKLRAQLYQRVNAGALYAPSSSSTLARSTLVHNTTATSVISKSTTIATPTNVMVEASSTTERVKLSNGRGRKEKVCTNSSGRTDELGSSKKSDTVSTSNLRGTTPAPHKNSNESKNDNNTNDSSTRVNLSSSHAHSGQRVALSRGDIVADTKRATTGITESGGSCFSSAATRSQNHRKQSHDVSGSSNNSSDAMTRAAGRTSAHAYASQVASSRTDRGVVDAKRRGQSTRRRQARVDGVCLLSHHKPMPDSTRHRKTSARTHAVSRTIRANSSRKSSSSSGKSMPHDTNMSSATKQQQRVLPLVSHDMDSAYHKDKKTWNSVLDRYVLELLSGEALEPPQTTSLWTQAYASPHHMDSVHEHHANSHSESNTQAASASCNGKSTAATTKTYGKAEGDVTQNADAQRVASEESTPQCSSVPCHLYEDKLQDGFYACIRCGNPICAPVWQVMSSVRGIAMFQRMHSDALHVHISTTPYALLACNTGNRAASVPATSAGLSSSTGLTRLGTNSDACAVATGFLSAVPSDGRAEWMTGIHFVARCACCDGCMGIVSCAIPHAMQAHVQSGQILLLNSACVVYRACTTRANLAGVVIDENGEDSDLEELSGNEVLDSCRADLAVFDENDSIVSSVYPSSVSSASEDKNSTCASSAGRGKTQSMTM